MSCDVWWCHMISCVIVSHCYYCCCQLSIVFGSPEMLAIASGSFRCPCPAICCCSRDDEEGGKGEGGRKEEKERKRSLFCVSLKSTANDLTSLSFLPLSLLFLSPSLPSPSSLPFPTSFLYLPSSHLPPASSSGTLIETDDTIEVQGHVFHKPFVEKPISAEDHTVHIYFPSDYGGGCQQLFRKVCEYFLQFQIEENKHANESLKV